MTDGKNALEELVKIMKDNGKNMGDIKCAVVSLRFDYTDEYNMNIFLGKNMYRKPDEKAKYLVLKEGYTQDLLNDFIMELDDEYWDGFGGQELYGYVMFNDDSWLERHEYDGSEWWEYKKFFIPEQCKRITD
jgi:hypothetical protein